jgi:eukaryotic-like serine/threonine-protein kinase
MAKSVHPREIESESRPVVVAEVTSSSATKVNLVRTPFAAGEVIGGRYRVDGIVAEGGMGVIVAATHLELDETVAIKFLKPELAADPEIVGRFAREAKAAAKLKSEYTAAVHDVGISHERGPYIVMEYLEGEDFEKVLRRGGPIHYARATELMMQAGAAIAVAHAHKIIHRDIKPANLFLMHNDHGAPKVKVLDFGVSKAAITGNVFGGAMSYVKTASLVGSPAYMSPEQLRGKESVDVTTDIWSLGAVLYELITGTTPFTGGSVTGLYAAMLETTPITVAEHVPEVPAALSETIMRCFATDPRGRWQSVAELVVALAPFAPERARISVDRIVTLSKAAGLMKGEPGDEASIDAHPPKDGAPLPPRNDLPRLFQTLVDTHGGGAPMEGPPTPRASTLPRLFQTLVDTHGGSAGIDERSEPTKMVRRHKGNAGDGGKAPSGDADGSSSRTRLLLGAGVLLLCVVGIINLIVVSRRGSPAPATLPPPATVAQSAPPNASPAPPADAPAPETTTPQATTTGGAPSGSEQPLPRAATSKDRNVAGGRVPLRPPSAKASAMPDAAAARKPTDPIQRAIDDRK